MERSKLLQQLRTLADHPATPEHERASARARIAELTAPRPAPRRVAPPTAPAGSARLRGLRARPKGDPAFPEKWPFGWTGPRAPVEHEVAQCPDGSMAVGWKCPSCGTQVERRISAQQMKQFLRPVSAGKPRPLAEHLHRLVGGEQNQLCRLCWARWDSA